MLFYLLLFGVVLSASSDEIQGFINEAGMDSIGEITMNDETFLMHIVPSGMMNKKLQKMYYKSQLSDIIGNDNYYYKKFMTHMEKGYTMKDLTFNIYDDNFREATINLHFMIRTLDPENFIKVKEWAKQNINDDMFDYAERLCILYGPKTNNFKWKIREPPFLVKPNFYVNGETIIKALKLKSNMNIFNNQGAQVNQYYRTDNQISINTNYSGWNEPQQDCDDKIDYFTEDISLNAYYFGLHLLHPFWISNNEMDEINPRQAEHYYFTHQQLWARYQLEKLSMLRRGITKSEYCDDIFKSYLIYENGLPFPIRSNILGEWSEERAKLKAIDIGIKEFIARGFFIMDNGTKYVNLTADNYVGLIAKIIRANYDEPKIAKIVRLLGGYGRNGYPKIGYIPAPSLMHQPETSLRDPAYWYLIDLMLNYFYDFEKTLEPFDISEYESKNIVITEANFTKITTVFDYYQFVIDAAKESSTDNPTVYFTARQKRLHYLPITIDFTIVSKYEQDARARLFLGPRCLNENCWQNYRNFFELDVWSIKLEIGENFIRWSPNISNRFSSDAVFNKEDGSSEFSTESYNMFKFPKNLMLPKGLEDGLNMTLFIIVTPQSQSTLSSITENSLYFNVIKYETDEKPLGFPFHRRAKNYQDLASNYRFYNITIFHKRRPIDRSGYFSPHLY